MHRILAPLLGLAVLVGTAACSDDMKKTTTNASAEASVAPEDKLRADADVTIGLGKMLTQAKEVVTAGTDKAAAQHAYDQTHETWESIEGTVKQKEADIYASIEEDLAALKAAAGDATKAGTAVASLTTNVNLYLGKHPG